MGKLTLLIVLAAVLGGSLVTFHARSLSNETARERGEIQHDFLAREAAASGQSVVLNAMLGGDGFAPNLRFAEGEVPDGRFTVDAYDAPPDATGRRHEVAFAVTGHSGGASHTLNSRYRWDPVDFPGPIWLDVPFAAARLHDRAIVEGGPERLPAYLDPRLFQQLQLDSFLDFDRDVRQPLTSAFGSILGRPRFVAENLEAAGLLEDVNVSDARGLYYAAIDAHRPATDPLLAGPVTVSNTRRFAGNKIALVRGDLTIDSTGRIEGDGALVVEGALRVLNGGQLDWDGLVIVHSEMQLLPVELDGHVRIDGALVVSQLAFPPGGHMDFTVLRDVNGTWNWTADPRGNRSGAPRPYYGAFAYQHTHHYDGQFGNRVVPFIRNGAAAAREEQTRFYNTIQQLGDEEVYLEFANHDAHGFARYTLDVAGEPEVYQGMVMNGFPTGFQGGSTHRTGTFRASALRTFEVDVRSLRALQQLFDGEPSHGSRCAPALTTGLGNSWPICVGENLDRRRALTVRLKKRTGELLYEGALYWHMQAAEYAQYLVEQEQWLERLRNGEAFGTRLSMRHNAAIYFDLGRILAIGTRLGFDGPEVVHLGTWANHVSREQGGGYTPSGYTPGDGTDGGTDGPGGEEMVVLCHGNATMPVPASRVPEHLLHGDTLGACPSRR